MFQLAVGDIELPTLLAIVVNHHTTSIPNRITGGERLLAQVCVTSLAVTNQG